jgi:hypothetical protein
MDSEIYFLQKFIGNINSELILDISLNEVLSLTKINNILSLEEFNKLSYCIYFLISIILDVAEDKEI